MIQNAYWERPSSKWSARLACWAISCSRRSQCSHRGGENPPAVNWLEVLTHQSAETPTCEANINLPPPHVIKQTAIAQRFIIPHRLIAASSYDEGHIRWLELLRRAEHQWTMKVAKW